MGGLQPQCTMAWVDHGILCVGIALRRAMASVWIALTCNPGSGVLWEYHDVALLARLPAEEIPPMRQLRVVRFGRMITAISNFVSTIIA